MALRPAPWRHSAYCMRERDRRARGSPSWSGLWRCCSPGTGAIDIVELGRDTGPPGPEVVALVEAGKIKQAVKLHRSRPELTSRDRRARREPGGCRSGRLSAPHREVAAGDDDDGTVGEVQQPVGHAADPHPESALAVSPVRVR